MTEGCGIVCEHGEACVQHGRGDGPVEHHSRPPAGGGALHAWSLELPPDGFYDVDGRCMLIPVDAHGMTTLIIGPGGGTS